MPGIIVGVDGSSHSRRALEWAINEAAVRHLPLTVLTVRQPVTGFWYSPVGYPAEGYEDLTEHARKEAQEETDDALGTLAAEARPPEVTVLAAAGAPAEVILRAAQDADMVVVGSRGAGGFTKLLLGSVSSQIVHHACCPVVVIPDPDS